MTRRHPDSVNLTSGILPTLRASAPLVLPPLPPPLPSWHSPVLSKPNAISLLATGPIRALLTTLKTRLRCAYVVCGASLTAGRTP